jgi:hypothetical protein
MSDNVFLNRRARREVVLGADASAALDSSLLKSIRESGAKVGKKMEELLDELLEKRKQAGSSSDPS